MKNSPRVRVLLGLQPLTTTAYPLRVRGQNHDVVPPAWEIINHLDSGLRRNDVVFSMDNLGLFKWHRNTESKSLMTLVVVQQTFTIATEELQVKVRVLD